MNVLFKTALVNYLNAEDDASKAQLFTQMELMLSGLTVLDLNDEPAIFSEDEDDPHSLNQSLYSNAIGVIVQLLQTNDSVRHLIFSGNMIDDMGAIALLELLTQHPFPVFVDLRENDVSDEVMQQLFELYQEKVSQFPALAEPHIGAYSSFSQFLASYYNDSGDDYNDDGYDDAVFIESNPQTEDTPRFSYRSSLGG